MESIHSAPPRWISILILVGAGLFMFALILSAVFEPSIRLLHALQLLIYVAVIVLARRDNVWGFGAGCLISAFWNYINLPLPQPARRLHMTWKHALAISCPCQRLRHGPQAGSLTVEVQSGCKAIQTMQNLFAAVAKLV